ncbi:hypothetical protein AB4Z54_24465, partial [Streptomyces sp. MCAF7]
MRATYMHASPASHGRRRLEGAAGPRSCVSRRRPSQAVPCLRSLIFCGTGASHHLHQARILAGDLARVSEENRVRLEQAGRPADPVSPSPTALLPVTWLHPLPLDTEDDETFHRVLAGFEADLSLYRLEEHALSKHAVELHRRTGGYFKALAYVISTAAVIAIRSGSEN